MSKENLLECVPPAAEIREQLDRVLAEVKQLRILLRTATAIERQDASDDERGQTNG